MKTPKEKAKSIIDQEVYYWGDKGLETTQRCAIKSGNIRAELINIKADEVLLDYWIDVLKFIYELRNDKHTTNKEGAI